MEKQAYFKIKKIKNTKINKQNKRIVLNVKTKL